MKYPNKHTAAKWRELRHFVLDHIASSFQYHLMIDVGRLWRATWRSMVWQANNYRI
jgi:hypothetical protein